MRDDHYSWFLLLPHLPLLHPAALVWQFGTKTVILPNAELLMIPLLTLNENVSIPRKPVFGV